MSNGIVPAATIAAGIPKHLRSGDQLIADMEARQADPVVVNGGPPNVVNEIEAVLARADRSHNRATRVLAGRIRRDVDELRGRLKAENAEAQALARIEGLRRQLDRANAELKTIRNGGKPQPAAGAEAGPPAWKVRQWAMAHGIDAGRSGRIPQHIVDQYLAAQNTGGTP